MDNTTSAVFNPFQEATMSELAWKELSVEEKEWRAKWFTDGPKTDLVR